ncbi:MAG: hypothetical protein KDK91_33070 [Gammaproteobacteria bacterium]|nr:hypothetical protein [Gammaproteobacteria bacterium]
MAAQMPSNDHADSAKQYADMEERMLMRDQKGASQVFYDLVRAGRPVTEVLSECVRIHAPYTHVPYHERIDDGYPNFVNNDHCMLSARASLNLSRLMPKGLEMLPVAQTVWYIPTGLDIWNQKLNKAPGHYTRGMPMQPENPPMPVVYWPDQAPTLSNAPLQEQLGEWMTSVHRGEVNKAYSGFLGIMADRANHQAALAELVFAGLIDVQDRMYMNRSYTTGHKGYRARSTVELGNAIGWDNAHHVLYAGVLDMAVGPRWYSLYETACNIIKERIEGEALHAVPYAGVSAQELEVLGNTQPLTEAEEAALLEALLDKHSPDNFEMITALLKAGKSPRRIIDVCQVAAARIIVQTHGAPNFSMPMHCYEYTNALGWFYDNFDHPRRLRLLYVCAEFLNMTAWHQRLIGEMESHPVSTPAGAARCSAEQLLEHLESTSCAQDAEAGQAWLQAYLDSSGERDALVQTLAVISSRIGNDPHNQEIPQNMLEDYLKNRSPSRDIILKACVQHCAGHRKYGDLLEASRRFGEALAISRLH